MFKLAKVIQVIDNGFDEATTAEEGFLEVCAGRRFHVFPARGDQVNIPLGQRLRKPLGEVALIGQPVTEGHPTPVGEELAVVHVTGSQLQMDQLPTGIDDGVQLKAIKPAPRGLTARRDVPEDPGAGDAPVVAHGQGGRINHGNAVARALQRLEPGGQRRAHQGSRSTQRG